ncbi:MAG: response regulator [Verrucomicrobiota bacterium]
MSKKVLIIDRDPIRRSNWSGALENEGFSVSHYESGNEALKHLLFHSVNAIILEYGAAMAVNSPISEGAKVVKEITEVDAFVPLILVCDRSEELKHETSAAADLVLRHPLTATSLATSMRTILSETLTERAQRKSRYIYAFR